MKIYKANEIRNVVLISHGGAGKTSLCEAVLFDTGALTRLGRVEDGTTVSDYDPDEIKRHSSINCTVVPAEWKNAKINLLDTPGYADFVGEVKAGLRVADAALVVVTAEKGVEVGTELVWQYADELKLPRMVFVNKLDRENTRFEKTLESLSEQFGKHVIPLQLPIGEDNNFRGVIDLVTMQAFHFSGGKREIIAFPIELKTQAEALRDQLIERAVESDDDIMTKYLDGEELSNEEITTVIKAGTTSGALVPVLCGSATKNIGIETLLDAMVEFFPSAAQAQTATHEVRNGNLAAFVFKTTQDPHKGQVTCFRLYAGSLRSDSHVFNINRQADERIGQLLMLKGKMQEPIPQLEAGDIGAVVKLQNTHTGDTLCLKERPVTLEGIRFPAPAHTACIEPKSQADLDKLSNALSRIMEEDPTIKVSKSDSGQTLLSGIGESHLQMIIDRMHRKFGIEVSLHEPRIPYRETIRRPAKAQGRHKKQTGGHGQFGDVTLEIEPYPEGDFEFVDKVVGGAVPRQYIPAVEKGVRESIVQGFIAGYPMTHLRVALVFGSYHAVDSSEMAFKTAAHMGMKAAVEKADPYLLEPIHILVVTVPDAYMGDIISDLNTKRGRVLGMESIGSGLQEITAQVPLAELLHYAKDLRSITQGRGRYRSEFYSYEEVPSLQAQKIIEEESKHHSHLAHASEH